MPKDNKVTKPCPKEEEKKKSTIIVNAEDKKPEDEEEKTKAEIPQWGLDLKASVERIIDLMERKADPEDEKPVDEEEKQDDEEEKPKDEEKQEEKPVDEEEDEEKQDDEDEEDAEEKNKALTDMVKTAVDEAVERLGTIKIAKRSKAGDGTVKPLDIFAMHGVEWSQIHKASGFPDVPDYDLTTVPGWNGQSSLLIRTRKEN